MPSPVTHLQERVVVVEERDQCHVEGQVQSPSRTKLLSHLVQSSTVSIPCHCQRETKDTASKDEWHYPGGIHLEREVALAR
jgi:hypothetical protein